MWLNHLRGDIMPNNRREPEAIRRKREIRTDFYSKTDSAGKGEGDQGK